MTSPPTFFFSHARQDRQTPGRYLRRFFRDLEIKLAQWAGVDLDAVKLGTIDTRIEHGADWDEDLSRGLRKNRTFLAIYTPLYFKRENCGKELAVFLQRSPDLEIDENGALTGINNVMAIRWLPEQAYRANTTKDMLIPPILRRVNDTPADPGQDEDITQAIRRYRKKGMEKCVHSPQYYEELIDLFVNRIKSMPDLPEGKETSFATAPDAFNHDWSKHLSSVKSQEADTRSLTHEAIAPRALASIVAFYITDTDRPLLGSDPNPVEFAASLIAEKMPDATPSADPDFDELLADVRSAANNEGLDVFHAVDDPVVPISPEGLIDRLSSLTDARVITCLVIDPTVWPGTTGKPETNAIDQIIRSSRWTGPVLLPEKAFLAVNLEEVADSRNLPPRLVNLPKASEERVALLRRFFVETRGILLRASTGGASDAEMLPILGGIGAERT